MTHTTPSDFHTSSLLERLKDVLIRAGKRIIDARQRQANFLIAQHIAREYPNESFEHIVYMLNEGRGHELFR